MISYDRLESFWEFNYLYGLKNVVIEKLFSWRVGIELGVPSPSFSLSYTLSLTFQNNTVAPNKVQKLKVLKVT